ncbi:conserved unknown protein [Ectocarpus siliculosus]|uniref:Ribosomal protein L1 n=1 Tax=Ectocarpus siliculosus TaxID=2880 RepID=D7G5C3_ECTSI|nr:conserved unknown protein [Ectocarpus siliculosus]|eukprot:CBJ27277.1 conserved unknown protein [Ectocarpus siliculosus]
MVSFDEAQVRRAARALLKHVNSSAAGKQSLIEDEGEVVLAQISLHKIPGDVKAKPVPIAIPHPLRKREDCDMCLIVKDNAKVWIKEMAEKEPVEGLTKIIKLDKLRTQYKDFKDRRELLSQFDLFLADDRILPMLTKALGKTFLKVKKQPVPIKLERRASFAKQIARARDSAFLVGSHGDCWAVKLANTSMTEDQVVENLMTGVAAVVEKIPRKWKNVKAINIKCSHSVALPVYSNIGDLPPAPSAKKATVAGKEEAAGEGEGKEPNSHSQAKKRKPRPLIRQQLNKLKEEAKAEKAASTAEAATASGGAKRRKKRAASENEEPNVGGDSAREGAGRKVKKIKAISPKAASGSAGNRRKTSVA